MTTAAAHTFTLPVPAERAEEAAARRALRDQIARLDAEAGALDPPLRIPGGPGRGPRLLSVADLEVERDRLAAALREARRAADERGRTEQEYRCLREEILRDPAAHPFVRVSNAEIGEPGCHDWHVRPRFGVLGMLMRWWRVKISSGCPLSSPAATPAYRAPRHPPARGDRTLSRIARQTPITSALGASSRNPRP